MCYNIFAQQQSDVFCISSWNLSVFVFVFCVAHGSNYGLDRGNHIHPIFVGHTAGARAEEGRDDGFVGGNREISEGRGWIWP